MLRFIDQKQEVYVYDIWNILKLDQSICSQHLRLLRDAGFVTYERNGKQKSYRLNYDKINTINNAIEAYFKAA